MTERRRGPKVVSRERKLEVLRGMLKGSQIVRLLPQEPCMFRGDAINLHTVWSLEREGLITREAYRKGILAWSISDKGKEAVREADEGNGEE